VEAENACKNTEREGMGRSLRAVGYLGIAAALVYIVTTALGSALDPHYSQIQQHVSDLTAGGAPTRAALAAPYLVYNLLAFAFAVCLYKTSDRGRLFKTGLVLLSLNSLAGIMMVVPFREDLQGSASTVWGSGHIAWAGVSSLVIVVASFLFGVAFRRSSVWRALWSFSIVVGIAFLIIGPLTVVATSRHSLAGLAERGSIGLYILWLLVVGTTGLAMSRRATPEAIASAV
jgi:hypothetical membrane protein